MRWKCVGCIAALVLLVSMAAGAAAVPYESYTYNYWQQPVPSPPPYVPVRSISGIDLDVGRFNEPQALAVRGDAIYVLDSGNNRLVRIHDGQAEVLVEEFEFEGEAARLSSPQGLYVTADHLIYVADTQNGRVIVFDQYGRVEQVIGPPVSDLPGAFAEDFRYQPRKVVVDRVGRMYVIASGIYEGMLQFDQDGQFRGFIGAPRVAPTAADVFWHRFATEEQRSRMSLFLPTEYTGMDVDRIGFIAATLVSDEEAIRRLNLAGASVLRSGGFVPLIGDILPGSGDENGTSTEQSSAFVDIISRDHGILSVLDRVRGRVFTYDERGNLLYVFGGRGTQLGTFRSPVSLAAWGEKLLVLDRERASITLFRPTAYGRAIHAAISYFENGLYAEATEQWKHVLRMNVNYDMAYSGIGRALLLEEQYQEAMRHFYLGSDREGYSEAFARYRHQVVGDYFGTLMTVFLVGAAFVYSVFRFSLFSQRRHGLGMPAQAKRRAGAIEHQRIGSLRRVGRELGYVFHLVVHPFDGFWDLKHERRGSVPTAIILVVLLNLTYIFIRQYTAFVFNPRDVTQLNLLVEFASVILPFLLWCIVSWALTTLLDGKGTFQDIVIATAYALTPIILINIPNTLLSHLLILEEGTFYYLAITVAVIWSGSLLLVGTMVTHDYDGLKTILVSLLSLLGMAFLLFLGMLFFSLLNRVGEFVLTLYSELILRT